MDKTIQWVVLNINNIKKVMLFTLMMESLIGFICLMLYKINPKENKSYLVSYNISCFICTVLIVLLLLATTKEVLIDRFL